MKFAWLSVVAALLTIALKAGAYLMTGSVGLLSDAAESIVNLVAAIVALVVLHQAAKPADERFIFGRSKAEYFSAGIEGAMILAAAAVIIFATIDRIINPRPLDNIGIGLLISVVASLINGGVALVLLRAGKAYRSPTLQADGAHLMTDVVTSAGVLLGIGLVGLTHWQILDPLVALAVAINITFTGFRLVRSSLNGLMDATLPAEQNKAIVEVLRDHASEDVDFHGLQTRASGREAFANVDLLVPGSWTVHRSHRLAETIKSDMKAAVPDLHVMVHVEPIEDPSSYDDIPEGQIPLDF
ncbi:cation diffusion facilitator family transporter [Actinomycetaceae bacterium L2_0104]